MPDAPAINLHTPIAELQAVTARQAKLLHRLEIESVSDLLRHIPARYEFEEAESTIDKLLPGVIGSARGEVAACRWVGGYGKKGRFEATLVDDTGRLHLTWFNARYLIDRIHAGHTLRVQGKVKMFLNNPQMANPRFEVLSEEQEEAAERGQYLRPIYPTTEGLPSRFIEQLIADVLPRVAGELVDPLPAELVKHHEMPPLAEAFRMVHRPGDEDEAAAARRRLAYNEFLLLQLGIAMKRAFVSRKLHAPALKINDAIDQHIVARFPFKLTAGQRQVIDEIASDLGRDRPMNRLLQGDVGSGKTIIALYAMLAAVAGRKQAALMAPTQLLAEQHYLSISRMLAGSPVSIELMTSSSTQRKHDADLIIGTQAILSEIEAMKNLAVIVIDEQHRFGVMQRAAFRSFRGREKGLVPHHLVMTATPIPRTLGLTIFGDLDVSTLRDMPPGRTPIINRVVGPEKTDEVYGYLSQRVERGEQAYVVVPAIDPTPGSNATGKETAAELRNVKEHARLLQDKYFRGRVASMHGRLKPETREKIMARFRDHKIDVLVSTTVIEVGVDVPNATLMVIEHAERFGLAQLHQLRGRVGRNADNRRSLCVFVANPTTESAEQRLKAIASTGDGFKIAEQDFEIRGMGEFFGTRQAGTPPLRIGRLPEQMDLLLLARRDAQQLIDADPSLSDKSHQLLRKVLLHQFGQALGLIDVG